MGDPSLLAYYCIFGQVLPVLCCVSLPLCHPLTASQASTLQLVKVSSPGESVLLLFRKVALYTLMSLHSCFVRRYVLLRAVLPHVVVRVLRLVGLLPIQSYNIFVLTVHITVHIYVRARRVA